MKRGGRAWIFSHFVGARNSDSVVDGADVYLPLSSFVLCCFMAFSNNILDLLHGVVNILHIADLVSDPLFPVA